LQELGDLLESASHVLIDISRRIQNGRHSHRLPQERQEYSELVDRLVNAYHLALHRYLVAISDALSAEFVATSSQNSIPAPPTPDANAAFAIFAKDLQQTREGWLSAVMRCNEVINETPSGLPQPDGAMRILKAGRERTLAFEKYQQALARFKSAASSSNGKPWPSA
jgi:hypothetical protein